MEIFESKLAEGILWNKLFVDLIYTYTIYTKVKNKNIIINMLQ